MLKRNKWKFRKVSRPMENRSKLKEVFIVLFLHKRNGQLKETEMSASQFKENYIYIFHAFYFIVCIICLSVEEKGEHCLFIP